MNAIEVYMVQFPEEVQVILKRIRALILATAPEAEELMAYGMPAYKSCGKPLVYFAAFKKHIGFYAIPSGHQEFVEELAAYQQGKGSVQFPLDKPIPYDLIERIVCFRLAENYNQSRQ